MPEAIWIDRGEELPSLARTLESQASIGLDTEFLRERTFFPKLCLLQLAAGLLADDWTLILLTAPLALALHFGAVMREEAYLERKFGATYLDFKRQVRRWI